MKSLFLPVLVVCLFGSPSARAIDCADYSSFDHMIPTPWLLDFEVLDSAPWGNSGVVFVGENGAIHLDFADPKNPTLVASVDGAYTSMDIAGDVLAVGCAEGVTLLTLPNLIVQNVMPFSPPATPAISGTDMVVVTGDSLYHYNISRLWLPRPIGSAGHGKWLTSSAPSIIDGHALVPHFWTGGMNDFGGMFVMQLMADANPILIQDQVAPPVITESRVWYQGIQTFNGVHYLHGTTFSKYPDWYPEKGFIAELTLDSEGNVDWGRFGVLSGYCLEDMAVSAAGLLIIGRDSNMPYSYGYNRYNWLVPFPPSYGPSLLPEKTGFQFNHPVVTVLLDKSLVMSGGSALHLGDLAGEPSYQNPLSLGSWRILEQRGDLCAILRFYDTPQPDGCGGWDLKLYDLASDPPTGLGDAFNYCQEQFDAIHWIGNRIILKDGDSSWYEMDVSDPLNPGPVELSALAPAIDLLEWGSQFVALQADGSIRIEPLPVSDSEAGPSARTISRAGHLARVGDLLYVTTESGTYLRDMTSPSKREVMTWTGLVRGVVGDINGDVLFAIEGDLVAAFDISDPRMPLALGTWSAGRPVVDLVCTENRVYVAVDSGGIMVLSFSREGGWSVVGGTSMPIVPSLTLYGDRLLSPYNSPMSIPLDCHDYVPTLVGGFRAAATEGIVILGWVCHETVGGGDFVVLRRAEGRSTVEVGRVAASAGFFEIVDEVPLTGGEVTYSLELRTATTQAVLATTCLSGGAVEPVAQGLEVAPNPANPRTTISFVLEHSGPVRLDVFSVDGRRIITLIDGALPAGLHSRIWDGRDEAGRNPASGSYLIRLETAEHIQTGSLSLIR